MGETLKVLNNNLSNGLQDGTVALNRLTFGGGKNGLWLKARMILARVQVILSYFKRFHVFCNLLRTKEANAIFLPFLKIRYVIKSL